jgi:acetyl esterase/lipase
MPSVRGQLYLPGPIVTGLGEEIVENASGAREEERKSRIRRRYCFSNAFALIYRPGARTACEDLARAIAFLHTNAARLEIDMKGYSLWGGSAGARMAAWLGCSGTESFGEDAYPRPAAVIMEYTGLSEVTGKEPPIYACVGTNDGIASYRIMQNRIDRIKANGTAAEIEVFQCLSHGFGLGEGTVAEGWIDRAVAFRERER